MKIEELKTLTPEIGKELKDMGILTVESLAIRNIREVKDKLKNVSENKLKQVFEEAWRLKGFWFTTADKLDEVRGDRLLFSTGSNSLNNILGGGVYTREITEFVGPYGAGKSQILYTLLVEALAKNKDFSAVFLDSEDTFRKERLIEIAEARGYDSKDMLSRTIYIPIVDTELFHEIIDRIDPTIESRNVKLLLADSIIAPLRAEYIGRELLSLRQQILNNILRRLLNLAKVYNLAVTVANQVVQFPVAQFTYDPIMEKPPTGGTILGHACNPRVYIRKGEGNRRIARVFDSSWLPEAEAVFTIDKKGVGDIEEKVSVRGV
jgi:DNA repair protein RadA